MSLFRKLLPFTRFTMLLWAWRNRASVLDWATFGVRTAQSIAGGEGTADARAEFRLRANLARDHRTRAALVDVHVEGGVAHLAGRLSPEVHALVQDIAVATPGVRRIEDRISHSLGRGGFLKRKARVAAA